MINRDGSIRVYSPKRIWTDYTVNELLNIKHKKHKKEKDDNDE